MQQVSYAYENSAKVMNSSQALINYIYTSRMEREAWIWSIQSKMSETDSTARRSL